MLHRDLERKYHDVGIEVDNLWHKFTKKQREKVVKQACVGSQPPKTRHDRTNPEFCALIPEYNVRDMSSKPSHFLNIFKFRALTALRDQLDNGADGAPGDRETIEKVVNGTINPNEQQAPDGAKIAFLDGKLYGRTLEHYDATMLFAGLPPVYADRYITSCGVGNSILLRQATLLRLLNDVVEKTLGLASETIAQKAPETSVNKALSAALCNLKVEAKSSVPELCEQATESKAALEDYLHLLRSEPVLLHQGVNTTFSSRAELVSGDRGRIVPAFTHRDIHAAFFDTMTTAVKCVAIWDYIIRLLQLFEDAPNKIKRNLIKQELSNACHSEYRRSQASFKHRIAPTPRIASKRFRRVINNSTGQSKIVMKGQPEDCTVSNPHLHYILRLCHPDTAPDAALEWIQKLDEHHALYLEDQQKLSDPEMAALGELVIIVTFIYNMSTTIPMVPASSKSGLLFTARSKEMEAKLSKLKAQADFGDSLSKTDDFLEPQTASDALNALDDFILKETEAATLGSLYDGTVQDSLRDLEEMYTQAKGKKDKADKETTYVPLPTDPPSSVDLQPTPQKTKEKTRPANSPVQTIAAPPEIPPPAPIEPPQRFTVKSSTSSFFANLFCKSKARGSAAWADFESAMADLGFSMTPRWGSMYHFTPPTSMNSTPITLHRPHASEVEGYQLLYLAGRLGRKYDWNAETFVVA